MTALLIFKDMLSAAHNRRLWRKSYDTNRAARIENTGIFPDARQFKIRNPKSSMD
jgi:hypothetical protein